MENKMDMVNLIGRMVQFIEVPILRGNVMEMGSSIIIKITLYLKEYGLIA